MNDWLLCLIAILRVSFVNIAPFFLIRPVDNRFRAAGVQRVPVIPSSILLAPSVSSPYLDANEGIDLQTNGSLGC